MQIDTEYPHSTTHNNYSETYAWIFIYKLLNEDGFNRKIR